MFAWLTGKNQQDVLPKSGYGTNGAEARQKQQHTGVLPAAAAAGGDSWGGEHVDSNDAPMTPVVYIVLWTSVAVGCLRGYAVNSVVAARVAPSFTYTFSGRHQAEILRHSSPYCTTGVDGIPDVPWFESVIFTVPPVLAPLLGAMYVRSYGRKAGIMLGCIIMLIGQVLMASAWQLVQLYIGSAVVTIASDVLLVSVALQDLEIAPRTSRGFFLMVHVLGYAFGCCAVAVVGYLVSSQSDLGWRLLFATGTLGPLAQLMVTPWLYETPHSSIERRQYAQGWEALREIRGPFYAETYAEFMSIVRAAATAPKGLHMYLELFSKRVYFPAICVGVSVAFLVALVDPLSRTYVVYQTLTRAGIGFNRAVLMSSLTLYGSYAVGVCLSVFLIDRVGRLPLLKVSSVTAVAVVSVVVGMAGMFAGATQTDMNDLVTPARWPMYQLGTLAVLAAGNGIAWSSAAYVVIFESQALAVRPAAVAVCISVTHFAAFVVEAKLLCALRVKYYILVLVASVLALIIAFGFVPETGRVSLEDISALYAKHWFWSRILNPKSRRKPHSSRPEKAKLSLTLSTHPSSSTSTNNLSPTATATRIPVSQESGEDAAAVSNSAAAAADADAGPDVAARVSPFGGRDVQAARAQSLGGFAGFGPHLPAQDSTTIAAEAAAAASVALAGAASRGASSGGGSSGQGLQHGRSMRRSRSLWLGGRRKSTAVPEAMSADAVDQLVDELMVDD